MTYNPMLILYMISVAQTLEDAQRYGPSDNCVSYCKGDYDNYCGGPGANQVYTMPPIPPPASTPSYTYMGCYQDDQVFDYIQNPPMPIKRRKSVVRGWQAVPWLSVDLQGAAGSACV